jgi:hypothetical protein
MVAVATNGFEGRTFGHDEFGGDGGAIGLSRGSLVLVASRSERQSAEFLRKALGFVNESGYPAAGRWGSGFETHRR